MAVDLRTFRASPGTAQADSLAADPGEITLGLGGSDVLSSATPGGIAWAVGGADGDLYRASGDAITIIQENGASPGDVYQDIFVPDLGGTFIAEVAGRHLLVSAPDAGGALLIVDWQAPEARIETWQLSGETPQGVQVVTLSFEEFRDATLSAPVFTGPISYAETELLLGVTGLDYMIGRVASGRLDAIGLGLSTAEARTVAYLYEAALGRMPDVPGLNFWIQEREGGLGETALAGIFLDSLEFQSLFGDPAALGDREFVERLYLNILDRPGEEAGVAFWSDVLGTGYGREATLLDFAKSPENVANSPEIATLEEEVPGFWDFA